MTLSDFLQERLDEEVMARPKLISGYSAFLRREDRRQRDLQARQAILNRYRSDIFSSHSEWRALEWVLKILATQYEDHLDYDPKWKVDL